MNKTPDLDLIWLIRYWLGGMMMYHSYGTLFGIDGIDSFSGYLGQNGFPFSYTLAIISKSIEFFGGLLLVFDIATRAVSFLIMSVMGVAVFYIHKGLIWSEGELAFNYLLMALILFFKPDIPFNLFKIINSKKS